MVIQKHKTDWRVKDPDVLVAFMESSQYTVRELANRVGVSHSTIGHLRTGYRQYVSKDTAIRIAKALRQKPGAIFEPKVSTVSREVGRSTAGVAA